MSYYKVGECFLAIGEKWCNCFLVSYPVSYTYNGGIVIDDEWYEGYEVPPPRVPKGFELCSIHCGLQLNACPPYATAYLRPLDGRKVSMRELKGILAAL